MPIGIRSTRPLEDPITAPIISNNLSPVTIPNGLQQNINPLNYITASFDFTNTNLFTMEFVSGWQYITFPIAAPQDVAKTFETAKILNTNNSPIEADVITIMKTFDAAVYWPAFGFNGIGNIEPGQAYQIKTRQAFTMTVPQLPTIKIRNFNDYSQLANDATIDIPNGWSFFGYNRTGSKDLLTTLKNVEYKGFPREFGHPSALPGTIPILSASYDEDSSRGYILNGVGTNFTEHFSAGDEIQLEFYYTNPISTGSITDSNTFLIDPGMGPLDAKDNRITYNGGNTHNTNLIFKFSFPDDAQTLIDQGSTLFDEAAIGWSPAPSIGNNSPGLFSTDSQGETLYFNPDNPILYNHGTPILAGGVKIASDPGDFNISELKIYGSHNGFGPFNSENWALLTTHTGNINNQFIFTDIEWIPTGSFGTELPYQYYGFDFTPEDPDGNFISVRSIQLYTGEVIGNETTFTSIRNLDGLGVKYNNKIEEVISDTKLKIQFDDDIGNIWSGIPFGLTELSYGQGYSTEKLQPYRLSSTEFSDIQSIFRATKSLGDIRNDSGSLIGYPELKIYKSQAITGSVVEDMYVIKNSDGLVTGFLYDFLYNYNGIGNTTPYNGYAVLVNKNNITRIAKIDASATNGIIKNQSIHSILTTGTTIDLFEDLHSGSNIGLVPKLANGIKSFRFLPEYEVDHPLIDQEYS